MFIELVDWHEANPDGFYGVDSQSLPDSAIILTFLKLTCEGHFFKNQEVLRTQVRFSFKICAPISIISRYVFDLVVFHASEL